MSKRETFRIRHVLGGINAYPSSCLVSQYPNPANAGQHRQKGTRNFGVFHPYVAPSVSERMKSNVARSKTAHPGKSNRFHFSRVVYLEVDFVRGMKMCEAMANGKAVRAMNRKYHFHPDIWNDVEGIRPNTEARINPAALAMAPVSEKTVIARPRSTSSWKTRVMSRKAEGI
jgi:hypothetical protein